MNKGIFQSGSVGSCEKQSDVFHHIRYANSPRAAVPHKSIDIPKPLITLEDYKEIERKLEKKLKSEGYGASHHTVQKAAKVIRALFFIFIFLPFYLGIQLPCKLISLSFSLVMHIVSKLTTPFLKGLDKVINFIQQGAARINLAPYFSRVLEVFSATKKQMLSEKKRKNGRFWENWTIPRLKIPKIHFKMPKFSLREKFPAFSWKFPNWDFHPKNLFKKRYSWKMFSFGWKIPSFTWKWNLGISLPAFNKFAWKMPVLANPFRWGAIETIREKIALKTLSWNFKPYIQALRDKLPTFNFKKKEKVKKGRSLKAAASALGSRIERRYQEFVEVFPRMVQPPLRVLGVVIGFVVRKSFSYTNRMILAVWRRSKRIFSALARVQENLQKMNAITVKAKSKTKEIADRGVEAVCRPLVHAVEVTHKKMIPIRLRFRRWTFLAGIVVELSLTLLSEAIIEFQDWNESHWMSKLQF